LPFDGALPEPFACGYCAGLKFHFSRAVAACRAEGVVRDAIHRFKYGRELYFERHLADWLLAAARERVDWAAVDAIVPVPLFPRKEREREFNQAELLSRSLGKAVGRPVIARKLRRVKETGTQTRLDAAARRENVRDAFAARGGEVFAGKRLALVDDVFTTGATLDACARVLHEMGAQDVIAITVARGV
jgi:ComF family protein